MSQSQIIEELRAGNVQAVIAALEEQEARYEAWAEEQAVARELSSTPELVESCPW
jgi:flagellar motility protein MotE (MotC chaperone)